MFIDFPYKITRGYLWIVQSWGWKHIPEMISGDQLPKNHWSETVSQLCAAHSWPTKLLSPNHINKFGMLLLAINQHQPTSTNISQDPKWSATKSPFLNPSHLNWPSRTCPASCHFAPWDPLDPLAPLDPLDPLASATIAWKEFGVHDYPLVNIQKANWKIIIFHGKINLDQL